MMKRVRLCSKNKDKKSESNSQPVGDTSISVNKLCSKNKDKKSESNSQLNFGQKVDPLVVFEEQR